MVNHQEGVALGAVSEGNVGQQFAGYRGNHTAPTRDAGSPLHDLTGTYPEDVYGPNGPRYYGASQAGEGVTFRLARQVRGNPDAPVTIHRAVPKDAPDVINPGDWVSTARSYAREHGESHLNGNYKIVSQRVPAKHIYTNGDSIVEWGYDPDPK